MTCLLSVASIFLATFADKLPFTEKVPDVSSESVEAMLEVMASSMLVIAVFAIGAMISAYATATRTATPRSFPLIVADDVSKNALSTFIGAFIFSVVALTIFNNKVFDIQGRFALLVMTLLVFLIVILMLLRWVDRIARLGRIRTTIAMVEAAAAKAVDEWGWSRQSGESESPPEPNQAVRLADIGYLRHVNVEGLQQIASDAEVRIYVDSLPGAFFTPDRTAAFVCGGESGDWSDIAERVRECFVVGDNRDFDQDPRFGFIALTEIACRALSPGVNDPGTAIEIMGAHVRLFARVAERYKQPGDSGNDTTRVFLPPLSVEDLFDDAFRPLSRDGAAQLEVVSRMIKGMTAIGQLADGEFHELARTAIDRTLARAESCLDYDDDAEFARQLARPE